MLYFLDRFARILTVKYTRYTFACHEEKKRRREKVVPEIVLDGNFFLPGGDALWMWPVRFTHDFQIRLGT